MRIPLRRGRMFDENDKVDASRVALVNEAFARHFWPGEDAVGKRIRFPFAQRQPKNPDDPWTRIVGVVADVKTAGLDAPTPDEIYFPYTQGLGLATAIVVRGPGGGGALAPVLRQTVRDIDPELPLFEVITVDDALAQAMAARRFTALLLALFAATALALAALGNYGVMAYAVGQRDREIAVRMALGAREEDVLRMVVGHALRLVGVGLVIGVAGLFVGGRLLRTLLFGVTPSDPLSLTAIAATLIAVALAASWLPARRAARVSPMSALRRE